MQRKRRLYILSDGRAVIAEDEDQAVFGPNVFGGLQLTARPATKAELASATAAAVAAQKQRDPGWHAPTWNGRQILSVTYSGSQGITARCLQSLDAD